MKILFTVVISLAAFFCFAQPKKMNVYFLKNSGTYVDKRDSADFMRIVTEPDSGSKLYNVAEYYINGAKKLIGKSSKIDPPWFEGQRLEYYKKGTRKSVTNFKNGLQVGNQYLFYPNGKAYLVKEYPDNGDRYNDIRNNYLIKAEYDSLGTLMFEGGNGYYKEYDDNFKAVIDEGPVKNGKRDGAWKGYNKGLKLNFAETYKDGELINGTATDTVGKSTSYSKSRGTPPEFKGGVEAFGNYLGTHINYPTVARENDQQGVVVLSFVVEKDGKITGVKVRKSVSKEIDEEAVRVIENSPRWVPGMQFGRPVRVSYSVPVNFALTEQ